LTNESKGFFSDRSPDEARMLIDSMIAALEVAVEHDAIRDGMVLLKAIDLTYSTYGLKDPGLLHILDQMRAAFNEDFKLTESDWLMLDIEESMGIFETHPHLLDTED